MNCISLESTDPFFNLAIEEILLKNSDEEYLILGINSPSVVIGKHQIAHREANTEFTSKNSIPVIRRITGGGTVYHDGGNLNFTFIRQSESGKQIDFLRHTQPVIIFLSNFGVEAKLEGKNDLKVGGLKISGNAEHVFHNRVLHHGTLLFSSSLEILRSSLRSDTSNYTSRAVMSNPSSVTNLNNKLNSFRDINEFRLEMMNFFMNNLSETSPYQLSQGEREEAELLAQSKYRTWEWNYAYGPEYRISKRSKLGSEEITFNMFVKNGLIEICEINGSDLISSVAAKLIGCRHMAEDMKEVFRKEIILLSEDDIYKFF